MRLHLVWPRFTTRMIVSNDGGFRRARSVRARANLSWLLQAGTGSRTVYVRFVSPAGRPASYDPNPLQTYSDDINLVKRARRR